MCCALALLGILGPRVLIVFWWLVDPVRWGVVFNNEILLPLLGFFFLPWTTVMYVLAWTAGGVDGFGWVLVGLGLAAGYRHVRRWHLREQGQAAGLLGLAVAGDWSGHADRRARRVATASYRAWRRATTTASSCS